LGERCPEKLETLGDHLRATRLARRLKQREVADKIGVKRGTVNKWERNAGTPRAQDVPGILEFLGYDPLPEPGCFSERMKDWRLRNGFSARAAARHLGLGEATWAGWERGKAEPITANLRRVKQHIG